MEDVIRGFEAGGETHDIIEFISSQAFECLDKKEAKQAHNEILKTYNIAKDRRL
jgi:hypothetical protein